MEIKRKLVDFSNSRIGFILFIIFGIIGLISIITFSLHPIMEILLFISIIYISIYYISSTILTNDLMIDKAIKNFEKNKNNICLLSKENKISYEDAVRLMYSGKVYRVYKEDGYIIIQI